MRARSASWCITIAVVLAYMQDALAGAPPADEFESDDTTGTASFIGINSFPQLHSFTTEADEDWAYFHLLDEQFVDVETFDLGADATTLLELFLAPDFVTPIASDFGNGPDNDGVSSFIFHQATQEGLYYVRATFVTEIFTFGPDCTYSLRVKEPTAQCTSLVFEGTVEDSTGTGITGALVEVQKELNSVPTVIRSASTFAAGFYELPGHNYENGQTIVYALRVSKAGYATSIVTISVDDCTTYSNEVTLEKDSLPTPEVDFSRSELEDQVGTGVKPYGTLTQALAAVTVGGTVNLQPGISSETFSGGTVISKAMTLIRDAGASGSVVIGQSGGGSRALQPRSTATVGFVASGEAR